MQTAADALRLKLLIVRASTPNEVDSAIATLVQQRGDALIVAAEGFFASRRDQLATLVTRHAIPAMFDSDAGEIRALFFRRPRAVSTH
jgi:putative ABC transport system substrate-binding protein